ncbi:MAG TPA: AprI/Inh family metalloprotease inhibitor, partial [Pyrinomonadaceae bacterium]|nr:AprI/Inh family metalloprotease inhibitor [Pyrinomonadaceae bacterium]
SRIAFMKRAFFLLILFFVTPAFAIDDDTFKATAGDWLVAPDNGKQGCVVSLGVEQAIGGYAATEKQPCSAQNPLHDRVYSWNFSDGGILFLDATRKVILRLQEQEGGPYRTAPEAQPAFLMAKGLTKTDRVPMAAQIFNSWSLSKMDGTKLCEMDLQNQPPESGEKSYALSLSKDCDASIKKLKLASWRIEGFDLMLYGTEGEALSFAADGKGNFISDDQKLRLTR